MKKGKGGYHGHGHANHTGSPAHTGRVGPGPMAGTEEQERKGPGMSEETRGKPDSSVFPGKEAASGKGIRPKMQPRNQEEDE